MLKRKEVFLFFILVVLLSSCNVQKSGKAYLFDDTEDRTTYSLEVLNDLARNPASA